MAHYVLHQFSNNAEKTEQTIESCIWFWNDNAIGRNNAKWVGIFVPSESYNSILTTIEKYVVYRNHGKGLYHFSYFIYIYIYIYIVWNTMWVILHFITLSYFLNSLQLRLQWKFPYNFSHFISTLTQNLHKMFGHPQYR